jgi:hypothetical protein
MGKRITKKTAKRSGSKKKVIKRKVGRPAKKR